MAHIPYGYKIIGGKAVPEPDQVQKINSFFHYYMIGNSVVRSASLAGLPLSRTACIHILENKVYTGDGYYPQIVPAHDMKAAAEEKQRRQDNTGHHRKNSRRDPPGDSAAGSGEAAGSKEGESGGRFILGDIRKVEADRERQTRGTTAAAQMAALIYASIREDLQGHRHMTKEETAAVLAWHRRFEEETYSNEHQSDTGKAEYEETADRS